MTVIPNPILNPANNDLVYLLLHNADRGGIRVEGDAQMAVATRLLKDGYLDEDTMTGRLIATARGRALKGSLCRPGSDVSLAQIEPPKRGRQSRLEGRVRSLTRQLKDWQWVAERQQNEISRLVNENRLIREYTGTDTQIAGLSAALKERDEMIAGLRETIKSLREGRS